MSEAAAMRSTQLRRVKGPSAYEGSPRRFVYLAWTIAYTEFRANYFGSVLGPAWALLRPLMLFGVLYLVFTHVIRFGDQIENYPAVLLLNLVLFNFFSDATVGSLTSVVRHENVVRKMQFPRIVMPLSAVLTVGFVLLGNLVVVFVWILGYGVDPTWTWLLLPVIIASLAAVTSVVGVLLSALFVRFRDIAPIWEVASQSLFYASPILYVATILPEKYIHWYMLNPLAVVLSQMRHAMIDPSAPSAAALIGFAGTRSTSQRVNVGMLFAFCATLPLAVFALSCIEAIAAGSSGIRSMSTGATSAA